MDCKLQFPEIRFVFQIMSRSFDLLVKYFVLLRNK